jgi:predicted transcriptional regulator
VVSEILDVCRVPKTKVQILEHTGLSMRHLHFCLKHLLKQNLVRLHHRKKTYTCTEKGLRYLEVLQLLPQD